jgi:hypothetical protein
MKFQLNDFHLPMVMLVLCSCLSSGCGESAEERAKRERLDAQGKMYRQLNASHDEINKRVSEAQNGANNTPSP